jgi:hypothetical protein
LAAYGAAQDSEKGNFLTELVRLCDTKSSPLMVGVILILFVAQVKKTITGIMIDGHPI